MWPEEFTQFIKLWFLIFKMGCQQLMLPWEWDELVFVKCSRACGTEQGRAQSPKAIITLPIPSWPVFPAAPEVFIKGHTGKTIETVKHQRLPVVQGRAGVNRATKLLCTIVVGMWHYAFVKTHRMHNTKSELNVNYGLPLMMASYWLIAWNTGISVVQDVSNRRHSVWGERGYVRSFCAICSIFL